MGAARVKARNGRGRQGQCAENRGFFRNAAGGGAAGALQCGGLAYSTEWLTFQAGRPKDAGMSGPMPPSLDATFAALADPTRRAILTMLLEDDMAVTAEAHPFAMSLAAISKHLSVLAEAGLITQEKRGRVKWCKLEPDALRAASIWMQGFGQFDPVDLDAFERFLETELSPTPDSVS
jgi:DNA-binding transcriptional ArsR family regulator